MGSGIQFFPQTLPPNSVVGRVSPTAGITESIPLATLAAAMGLQVGSGATLVNFTSPGTGAVVTTVANKLAERPSVKDFGATGNGVTDDTLAIQAALNSGLSNIFVPSGTYVYSTLAIPTNTKFYGESPFTTTLQQNSATLDGITLTGASVSISGFNFTASVTKTAGAFVNTSGQSNVTLKNFTMSGAFQGVKVNGGSIITVGSSDEIATIRNTVASTGKAIYVTGNNFEVVLRGIGMDAPGGSMPQAGIYIDQCGDVLIDQCNIIHQGTDLQLAPGTGQVVASVWGLNSFFDTATIGLNVSPTGTGSVVRCRFNGCWFSSHSQYGVEVNGGASSTIQGLHFIDPHIINNTLDGVQLQATAGFSDLSILGGEIANNVHGIFFNANMTDFVIEGVSIGAVGGVAGNSGYGIVFGGTIANCVIANNKLNGNTSGAINGGTVSGSNVRIANNAGFNPQGYAGITVTASPFTYTAGITSETVLINGGTVSLVAVNGNNVFQQTNCTVPLSAGETVTVTYTVAPGMGKYRH